MSGLPLPSISIVGGDFAVSGRFRYYVGIVSCELVWRVRFSAATRGFSPFALYRLQQQLRPCFTAVEIFDAAYLEGNFCRFHRITLQPPPFLLSGRTLARSFRVRIRASIAQFQQELIGHVREAVSAIQDKFRHRYEARLRRVFLMVCSAKVAFVFSCASCAAFLRDTAEEISRGHGYHVFRGSCASERVVCVACRLRVHPISIPLLYPLRNQPVAVSTTSVSIRSRLWSPLSTSVYKCTPSFLCMPCSGFRGDGAGIAPLFTAFHF